MRSGRGGDHAEEAPLERARESGLVRAGEPLLVMLSGGADSVCLLDVAVRLGARVSALHVNHGLREGADADEALCRGLCERLGVELLVERPALGEAEGNLQAAARAARYAAAERLGEDRMDHAAAHTRSDQVETVLYRLATSPGRRALLGMAPRRGRLVRPLLEVDRAETRAYCAARDVPFAEDPSNADRRFARARVRHDLLPVLRELGPSAERTIVETSRELRDEAEVLDAAAEEVLGGAGATAVSVDALLARPPALARLALRRLAETAAGEARPLSVAKARTILDLARRTPGGSAALDLGGGLRALVEYGVVRFAAAEADAEPDAVALTVPGTARFGSWEVEARLIPATPERGPGVSGPPDEAPLDPEALGPFPCVRAWRAGDRMRPLGLGGTKSLQDLFTDQKVPRALRSSLPVVEARGEIAWVAGVTVGERFHSPAGSGRAVRISARRRPATVDGFILARDA